MPNTYNESVSTAKMPATVGAESTDTTQASNDAELARAIDSYVAANHDMITANDREDSAYRAEVAQMIDTELGIVLTHPGN